ncbi:MAG: hypothetical protein ACTHOG_10445 [Marmoricola sp.]
MKKLRLAHVLPAVVVAVLLGSGSAYATTLIYTNNIANNAVTSPKLAPAVRSAIANNGLTRYHVVTQYVTVPAGDSTRTVDVKCPTGEVALGGGAHYGNTWSPQASVKWAYVAESSIDAAHTGWSSELVTVAPQGASMFTANAVCAASH